jgi:ATP-dependent DNA ligase
MQEAVRGVIEDGGEGIIMRKIKSFYEHGRTTSLLKVKVVMLIFLSVYFCIYFNIFKAAVYDMEAIVVGIGEQNSVHLKLYVFLKHFLLNFKIKFINM